MAPRKPAPSKAPSKTASRSRPAPKAQSAPRSAPAQRKSLAERTSIAEWVAAGLGLLLTLGVIGYLVVEGVRERHDPPSLSVSGEPATRGEGGYSVPITVRNSSYATAAAVEVSGTLERGGAVVETRRATFAYVPGRGEATGGLVFRNDPAAYTLTLQAEGYEDP